MAASHGEPVRTATCSFQRSARGGAQLRLRRALHRRQRGAPHQRRVDLARVEQRDRLARRRTRAPVEVERLRHHVREALELHADATAFERRERRGTVRGGDQLERGAVVGPRERQPIARATETLLARDRRGRVALAARETPERKIGGIDLGESGARRGPHRFERHSRVGRDRLHHRQVEATAGRAVGARRVVVEEADAQRSGGRRRGRRRPRRALRRRSRERRRAGDDQRCRKEPSDQPPPPGSSNTTTVPASVTIGGLPTIPSTAPPPPTPTATKVRPSIW